MNDDLSKYGSLINLMEATPKAPAPDHFTERVMDRLSEPKPDLGRLLKLAMFGSGEITASGFRREYSAENQPCFYFLMAGLFFFFIGATILASLFYSSSIQGVVLAQAILFLMTAVLLAAAGLMLAARVPDASHWAKRAITVYGILIIANAFLIQANSKMALGEVFALTFGATGMMMGMVLMKALKSETNEGMAR